MPMRCKVLLLIFIVALPAATSFRAWSEFVTPSDRVTSSLDVRVSASIESEVVGLLQKDETAYLLERVPFWYRVELDNGQEGYVSQSWSSVISERENKSHDIAARKADELRIHFFDIGTGTCTLVECPGQDAHPIVVDCGSIGKSNNPSALPHNELRLLFERILRKTPLPDIVLSHGDLDHYNLIDDVLQNIKINSVWQGGKKSYNADFRNWLRSKELPNEYVQRGFVPNWHNGGKPINVTINGNALLDCGSASVYILTVNSGKTSNARSLMLMLKYHDFTGIFTGDATEDTERAAIDNFKNNSKFLHTTVLTGSHHGSNSEGSNSEGWADAVEPAIVVYSAGMRYAHPHCDSVNRLGNRLLTTELHEAVCAESKDDDTFYMTRDAEFMTRANGTITITTNGRSPLQLDCQIGPGCTVQVPF